MQKSKQRKRRKGKSNYAAKLARGNMMYGPGCCGHKIKLSIERIPNARRLRGDEEEEQQPTVDIRADYASIELRVAAHYAEDIKRRQLGEHPGVVPSVQAARR